MKNHSVLREAACYLLLILLPISLFGLIYGADQKFEFTALTTDQGLSQNAVQCVVQDKQGFIWIGTQDGLNKYDGYRFTIYKHDPLDSTSLSENYIQSMLTDRDGYIWIGTINGGLNRFNPQTGRFRRYLHDPEDSLSLGSNVVLSLWEDHAGNIWVGTYGGGLNRLVKEPADSSGRVREYFKRFTHQPANPQSLSQNSVLAIFEDSRQRFWIGTLGGGLNRFYPEKSTFIHYQPVPGDSSSISDKRVWEIMEDRQGRLWIGTMDSGFNLFDPQKGRFIRHQHSPEKPGGLTNNVVQAIYEDENGCLWLGTNKGINLYDPAADKFYCNKNDQSAATILKDKLVQHIFEDRSGVVWVSTFGSGLYKYDPNRIKFSLFRHNPDNSNSLSHNCVYAIAEDPADPEVLWIGSLGGGLDRFDRRNNTFTHFQHQQGNPHSLSENFIQALLFDNKNRLWIATVGNGLNKMEPGSGRFIRYLHDPDDSTSISENRLLSLYEDRTGVLWIGTYGAGLNRFVPQTGTFERYRQRPQDSTSISSDVVKCMYEDSKGRFWIGTGGGGLNLFHRESGRFTRYEYIPDDSSGLNNGRVQSIYEDAEGKLWIATYGGGLNKFDPEQKRFIHYTVDEGLPHNSLYNILPDDQGNLWISTNAGLSRFNPVSEEFRNYDIHDGLQSNEFNSGAACRGRDGELFFGGTNGLNCFYPEKVMDNPIPPPLVLTGFHKFNKDVPLDFPVSAIKNLKLSYKDYVFSFEFSALDYSFPAKNRYAYMLDGFEKDWNYSGSRRYITYTNLDPGRYTFRVKGSNSDGVWNEAGLAIPLTITPPFWQTWWFTVLITILIGITGFAIIARIKEKERRKAALDRKISDLKLAALASQMKPHFVFNTINSIQYLIASNEKKAALDYLSKFSRLLRLTLENSLRSTIPVSRELQFLKLYLELEQFRFDDQFEFEFQVDPAIEVENTEIPIMCIQPFVENAILHGLPQQPRAQLKVDLQRNGSEIICTVQDNGIGILQSLKNKNGKGREHKSVGMQITRERLELLRKKVKDNGAVEVTDLSGAPDKARGTRVNIRLPFTSE
ncbi:MAG: two-component regulator propeller domain-containing protein [Calditrichia bacterium]